ncbi:MAG: hypothetical protein KKA42_12815 [candidate division Zixibacteria bacterium]|nr:hypothetical protein [candidate division Zixibacteria bacterium]
MFRRVVNEEHGVGLVEVLASMFVLTVGLLGLAPMLIMSVEGNCVSRDNTVAAGLAKEKIEYYESLETMPALPYLEQEDGLASAFTRVTRIDDISTDSTIPDGVYLVDVNVGWTDHQEIQRQTSITTFILKD